MDNGMDGIFGQVSGIEQPRVDAPAPEPAEQPAQAPEPSQERPRDETGRFAPRQAETPVIDAEKPVSEPAKPQAPLSEKETVGFYKAMQEERDKRQALERQLAELKAKTPPEAPIPAEQRMMQEIQRLQANQNRLEASTAHGADTVKAAYDWAFKRCDEDPVFNSRAMSLIQSNGNPYEVAVALRKEADELDALKTGKAQAAAPTAQTPETPTPTPPKSLADAPGNGAAGKAHVNVGEGQAFGSLWQ